MSERVPFGFKLSGLQEFIFDIESRNAAKRLRLRSAMMLVIPSAVAYRLEALDGGVDFHYVGGGRLLASAKPDAIEDLQPELESLQTWLLMHSGGRLEACWTLPSNFSNELASRSERIRRCNEVLARKRFQICRDDGWLPTARKIQKTETEGSLGDRDWEQRIGGEFLRQDDWKGFKLTLLDVGAPVERSKDSLVWEVGPWRIEPVPDDPDIPLASADEQHRKYAVGLPLYAPKHEHEETSKQVVTELYKLALDGAKSNHGAPYLAVLKMDGDGVGEALRRALQEDEDAGSYDRTSSTLSSFFGVQLEGLLKETDNRKDRSEGFGKDIYLVYSGGDDLVAIGHFWKLLKVAEQIQGAFQRLKVSTISAGVSAFHRQAPIFEGTGAADTFLLKAKAKDEGKNRICAFGATLVWSDFAQSLEIIEALSKEVKVDRTLHRSVLRLLAMLGQQFDPDEYQQASSRKAIVNSNFGVFAKFHYVADRRNFHRNAWEEPVREYLARLERQDEGAWRQAALIATVAAWKTKDVQGADR